VRWALLRGGSTDDRPLSLITYHEGCGHGQRKLSRMNRRNHNVFYILSDDFILTRNGYPVAIDLGDFPPTENLDSVLYGMKEGMRN
jgi:hypothetical protein